MPEESRATVSVAMIVKNEAETIELCLQSVRSQVDEIVCLVDDTTTDNTFELAREYADVVDYFHWEDNFSKARNDAIDMCTKDFVWVLDGHEVLHPGSRQVLDDLLRRLKRGGDLDDTDVISANIYMNPENTGDLSKMTPNICFLQPRMFRNVPELRYRGRVHNWLDTDAANGLKRPVFEFVIIHQRTSENAEARVQQRREMNIDLLKLDIEENPEEPRAYFYLAQTYMELDEVDSALEWYGRYVELSKWNAEKAQAMLQMAHLRARKGDPDGARATLLDAMKLDWERAEIYILLGDLAFQKEQWYEAEHWYLMAKDMRLPISGMFLHGPAYSYLPYAKLAGVYSQVQEWFEAVKNGEKSIELGNTNEELVQKLHTWYELIGIERDRKNIIIYDNTLRFTFIKDLRERMNERYNTAIGLSWNKQGLYDPEYSQWADIIWMEWLSDDAVRMTKFPKPEHQVWIVRLHGYELWRPHRMLNIDFRKVDCLVFVAEHTRRHFMSLYGGSLPQGFRTEVIHNGVNVDQFAFARREHSTKKNIGVIGVFTSKKGVERLAMVIRHFAKHRPEYRFLLRIDVPEVTGMEYFSFQHDLGGVGNWEVVPRVESMDGWMEDLKFVLSTSNIESFSYVVAEGMAKGIKPLIYDWYGARDLWPDDLIWGDFEELEALVDGPYESGRYRKWVEDRYSLDIQAERTFELFEGLSTGRAAKVAADTAVLVEEKDAP